MMPNYFVRSLSVDVGLSSLSTFLCWPDSHFLARFIFFSVKGHFHRIVYSRKLTANVLGRGAHIFCLDPELAACREDDVESLKG
jgi:hypothetical protein